MIMGNPVSSALIGSEDPPVPPSGFLEYTAVLSNTFPLLPGTTITAQATDLSKSQSSLPSGPSPGATVPTPTGPLANLTLDPVTVDSTTVAAGGTVTYTFVVRNTSATNSASGVVLADVLPAHTTFVSAGGDSGWTKVVTPPAVAGTISFTLSTLAAGASSTLTLTFGVPANYVSVAGSSRRS